MFRRISRIASVPEIVGCFAGGETMGERANPAAQPGYGSLGHLAQERLERAERHFDRVQVRRVFGQITKCRPTRFNRLSDANGLVCREVVHCLLYTSPSPRD